jgi:hypothetical protein
MYRLLVLRVVHDRKWNIQMFPDSGRELHQSGNVEAAEFQNR